MTNHVEEFCRRVSKAGDDINDAHVAIEVAYEQCIAANNIAKSSFLSELLSLNPGMFEITVNHLFTPINWSKVKLRTLWGVRNEATGNLLTLDRKSDSDVFVLKESSEDSDDLTFAPMMTGSEEDVRLFIQMLNDLPDDDAPPRMGETAVSLEVDKRINLVNLKAALVKVIF